MKYVIMVTIKICSKLVALINRSNQRKILMFTLFNFLQLNLYFISCVSGCWLMTLD